MTDKNKLKKNISKKIKEVRVVKGLTQVSLGEIIKLTKQAVSNVENETSSPSIDFLYNLAKELNVNLNWLIADIGEPFINYSENSKEVRDKLLKDFETVLRNHGI